MGTDRVVGELQLVAAPQQQAEGAVAVAGVARKAWEAPPQYGDRRLQLGLRGPLGHGGGDELRIDAGGEQPLLYALGTPLVQDTAVFGESARVAGVVEVALVDQRVDRVSDRWLAHAPGLQVAADLDHRSVSPRH